MTAPRYLVVQIDMTKHPREVQSPNHTGDGVLFPVSCDGHYSDLASANEVAAFLAEKHPHLRTYVVQIVGQA